MKNPNILAISYILLLFPFFGCATIHPTMETPVLVEVIEPIEEFFVTEMTLYNELRQRHLRIIEINEKESFIELIRQILNNPGYVFSEFQDDLFYVAQMYNLFSVGEFSARDGSTWEMLNSSGVQATYRNVNTGQLMSIRTQLVRRRFTEIIDFWLDSGYHIAVESFDRSQTVLARNYHVTQQTTETDFYTVYILDSGFMLILSDSVNGVLDGLEKEFNLLYMPDSIFNNVDWHVGNIPQSELDYFFQLGYDFVGIFDSSDGDFNIAIVRIDRVPNIEWKGFFYTNRDRNWIQLDNDWVYNNMFNWLMVSSPQPTPVPPPIPRPTQPVQTFPASHPSTNLFNAGLAGGYSFGLLFSGGNTFGWEIITSGLQGGFYLSRNRRNYVFFMGDANLSVSSRFRHGTDFSLNYKVGGIIELVFDDFLIGFGVGREGTVLPLIDNSRFFPYISFSLGLWDGPLGSAQRSYLFFDYYFGNGFKTGILFRFWFLN